VAVDQPDAPGRSGSWAEPNGPPRRLGIAPWPNQREAG
jgi:hypothetical protein